MELDRCSFYLVGNIPGAFHSSDLRAFFSQFVEKGHFVCFHYRHRPEYQSLFTQTASTDNRGSGGSNEAQKAAKTKCCVVAVVSNVGEDFIRLYRNKNWSHSDGKLLGQRVRINKLRVLTEDSSSTAQAPSTADSGGGECIPWNDLNTLPELNPPGVMPQGNVGTPLSTFMSLIRSCKLPSHVIKKLQLEFPKSRSKKRYGAVSLDYGTSVTPGGRSNKGVDGGEKLSLSSRKKGEKDTDISDTEDKEEEEEIPSDDDHDAEEWERFEAFHEDVDKQGRTSERLFEEELEVVWDKGSSGLVFYTDASYWDQQEGDFDEKCSKEDDWDVDMSGYYDHSSGDKDARDFIAIQREKRLREDKDPVTSKEPGIGSFEKHTKGIGGRVLKKSGWREGSGVGASNQGISEPLETEGQHPHVKRGLGYRGEKLDRHAPLSKRRKRTQDVIISTIYDKPAEEEDTVLRSTPATVLKYRPEHVRFLEGGVLKPDKTDSDQPSHSPVHNR